MAIFDVFSKRLRRQQGQLPDVFFYDRIPGTLRTNVVQVAVDTIGNPGQGRSRGLDEYPEGVYSEVHRRLCRESGVFVLVERYQGDHGMEVLNYITKHEDTLQVIDAIELIMRAMVNIGVRRNYHYSIWRRDYKTRQTPEESVQELNQRFLEHGFGYQFEEGQLVRVDSTYAHAEMVKPALSLVHARRFKGANQEFLQAHEHYRHGRHREAIVTANAAFESVLKVIVAKRKWMDAKKLKTAPAKPLILACINGDLVPGYMQDELNRLEGILSGGLPTVRNKDGGHGQGGTVKEIHQHVAGFALHMAAANIVFLVEADKAL